MRILYILPFVPWPTRVRSMNLIPRLARNHEIHLICLARSSEEAERASYVQEYCASVAVCNLNKSASLAQTAFALPTRTPLRIAYFASSEMRKVVVQKIRQVRPNVIYVERWRALQYIPESCDVPVICDPTDCMSLYNSRLLQRGKWWERILAAEELLKFRKFEPMLARRVRTSVFCSSVDANHLALLAPGVDLSLVPNGVNTSQFFAKCERDEEPSTVLFAGDLNYSPNRHAVAFFLNEVCSLIRRDIPQLKFLLVGRGSLKFMASRKRPEDFIEVHDFVPEFQPFLARATVSVVPIKMGAGVSNKVLEAFSVGTAVVSTQMACGDLPVRDREHLLFANNAFEFSESVVRLLKQPELRRRLSRAGRALVSRLYDWEIVAKKMENLLLSHAPLQKDVDRQDAVTFDHDGASVR